METEAASSQLTQFLMMKSVEDFEEKFFNHRRTMDLLDRYKHYKTKVGTYEIKNMKKLWELVAKVISNLHKITIGASKCENRFKVLERSYKTFVDNNGKTGRGRKHFEYEKEFDEMFGKKVNINPQILLSSNTEVILQVEEEPQTQIQENLMLPSKSKENAVNQLKRKRNERRVTPTYIKRNEILTDMKNDLKSYYEQKLKIDQEKLELGREKHLEKKRSTDIFQEYVQELKVFNMNIDQQ